MKSNGDFSLTTGGVYQINEVQIALADLSNGAAHDHNGGDGVFITSSSEDVSVISCMIRNTGAAGTGATSNGVGGKAVDDDVAVGATKSMVFKNFASGIANAINFDVQAGGVETGVDMTNPPTSTALNVFANLYV